MHRPRPYVPLRREPSVRERRVVMCGSSHVAMCFCGDAAGLSEGGAFPCGFISCDVFLGFLMVFVLLRAVFRLAVCAVGPRGEVFAANAHSPLIDAVTKGQALELRSKSFAFYRKSFEQAQVAQGDTCITER